MLWPGIIASPAQSERNRAAIRQRGADVGFKFSMDKRGRIYNTFDAHRLLHWAALEGHQLPTSDGAAAVARGQSTRKSNHCSSTANSVRIKVSP